MSTENDNPPIPGETKDAKGVFFDPARHLPRLHPKHQTWIPKSPGRGKKTDAAASPASIPTLSPSSATITDAPPSPPASESSGPATRETEEVLPPVEKSSADAPFATPPPPDFSDFEKAAAEADAESGDAPAGAAPGSAPEEGRGGGDAKSSPADLARVVKKGLYLATGKAVGNMKAAVPPSDQDKALEDMLGAFFRWRKIQAIGWVALGVGLLSYFLREEIWDAIKAMRKGKPAPRPVMPTAEPVTRPMVAPSQPANGVGPVDAPPFNPFAGGHF